jgi:hypothetical protein
MSAQLCGEWHMVDETQERRRARWRRNKRAAREAGRPTASPPTAKVFQEVLEERDRLAADRSVTASWRHAWFYKPGTEVKALGFAADVWAAKTILSYEFGLEEASPTRIARWLSRNGRTHGYAPASLRVMVYRALDRIQKAQNDPLSPWPEFPETPPEAQ